jgi:hypothetical protein
MSDNDEKELKNTCADCYYFGGVENAEYCDFYEKDVAHRHKEICNFFIHRRLRLLEREEEE